MENTTAGARSPITPLFIRDNAAFTDSSKADSINIVNIILLEDPKLIAARSSSDTAEEQWSWLAGPFTESGTKVQVIRYEYQLPAQSKSTSIWQSLIQSGTDLLQYIKNEEAQYKVTSRPVIFLAQGLGGIVLKKTLCTLHEQDNNSFNRAVLHVLAGIFFLGTPHPKYDHGSQHSWPQHSNLLLQSSLKLSKQSLIQAELHADLIVNLSFNFEKAGLDVPVFSIHETKATKVQGGLFQSRKVVLVDSAIAVTNLNKERLIAVDRDHHTLHDAKPGSQLHRDYVTFIQSVKPRPSLMSLPIRPSVRDDQSSAAGTSRVGGQPVDAPWASTASEYDIPESERNELSSAHQSLDATAGSTEIAGQYHILPTLTNFLEPKRSPKIPCYVLRPHARNPGFFGRKDVLDQIEAALVPRADTASTDQPALRSYALCGLGGLGKTQTAVEFAFAHHQDFDAIFWVQAEDSDKLAAGFSQIATKLGIIDLADIGNHVVSRDLALEWLLDPYKNSPDLEENTDAAEKAKWLLIFDNADDPELLRDYWPTAGEGSILITSRDPLAKSHYQSSTGLDLKTFNLDDATTLILKLADQDCSKREQEHAAELARRLDGLPLAITQVAAYIRRRDMTIKEVLDIFEKQSSFEGLQKANDHHGHTMFTVWAFEALSPAAMELLEVLSYLDPDSVSETILDPEVPPNDVKCLFTESHMAYIDARLDLLRSSLVVRNKEHGQITLHRLVQDVVRTRMTPERAVEVFKLATVLVYNACPGKGFLYEVSEWDMWNRVQPHMIRLQSFYEASDSLGRDIQTLSRYADLLVRYAWYNKEQGNFEITQAIMNTVLPICEEHGEQMPEVLADTYFCLVSMTAEMNRPVECLEYGEKHLAQRLKLPGDAWSHSMGYSERAMAHFCNRQFSEALEDCMKARSLTSIYFAFIHTAISLAGLLRYDEAATELTSLIEHPEISDEDRFQANTFPGSFRHGHALHNLGIIRRRQDRHSEAFAHFKRAFAIYQATLGMNHHYTGDVLAMLSIYHAMDGELQTASALVDQAISIFDRWPWYEPELARVTFLRAKLNNQMGDEEAYEVDLQRARRLLEKITETTFAPDEVLTLKNFDGVVASSVA